MRTTGIFTTHQFNKEAKENTPFNLYFFGDVHKGSPLHDKRGWKKFLDIARADKTALFLCTGDLCDIGSSSERVILNNHAIHDSTRSQLDSLYLQQSLEFARDIEFMKGRIIGIIGGNHDAVFQSGITVTQKVCEIVNTKFLGVFTLIRLRIQSGTNRSSIDICVHHGKGGGTAGNGINKVTDLEKICRADIYIMGDNHQKAIHTALHYYLGASGKGELRAKARHTMYGRSGSFLLGYADGEASYVTDMALVPAQSGAIKAIITPRMEHYTVKGRKVKEFSIDIDGATL